KMLDEKIDNDILQGIKLKQDLGIALTENQQDALDPNKDVPGIEKNKKKTWIDFKALRDISIKKA
ncbi:unnamed protein product, partial [marine sediment metagenome]